MKSMRSALRMRHTCARRMPDDSARQRSRKQPKGTAGTQIFHQRCGVVRRKLPPGGSVTGPSELRVRTDVSSRTGLHLRGCYSGTLISVIARARGIRSDGSERQLGARLQEGDSRGAAGGTAGSGLPYGGVRILRWIFGRIERPKPVQQRRYAPKEREHHASPRMRIISLPPR
jgi:hypothetical protein